MINKQKMWFLTLFSLILILSVYYITMPSEILMTNKSSNNKKEEEKVTITESDYLTSLQVEKDEERQALAAEYNEILTNKESTTDEKNNAYDGLKKIDEIKAKEEEIKSKIKKEYKLDSFIKIDNNSVSVVITKKDHDYSLANDIMRLVQGEFESKVYISVKFEK